jgi:hypothetical protein
MNTVQLLFVKACRNPATLNWQRQNYYDISTESTLLYLNLVTFQVLAAVSMNVNVLHDVTPCSVVEIGRRFRGSMDLRNVCQFVQDYMAQHSTRQSSKKINTFIFCCAEILLLITKFFVLVIFSQRMKCTH